MKIKINSKKISHCPNNIISETNVGTEKIQSINQLKQQIVNGNSSCILISGYRGVGKTTFVRMIEKQMDKKQVLFIPINLSKYESYSFILRKLIRKIYLNFSEIQKERKNKNEDLIKNIELLYEHTFYEVNSSSNIKKIKESSYNINNNFSIKELLKNFLPICAVVLSIINLKFNILFFIKRYINSIIFICSLAWLIIKNVSITFQHKKNKVYLEELNRKTLYDDEIAEYHLKTILNDLRDEGIKIIFLFDELDKIEDENDMNHLIADLKPLLLSDLATSFIIAGQQLYYKFINSNTLDDSIITSIFSKAIHIPLATNIELEKLFNSFVEDKNNLDKEIVKEYIDSLILKSNRVIRTFVNVILNDIIWENGESYLSVDENRVKTYRTDSIILEILTDIIENIIDNYDEEEGVKDFLSYQLFIWVKKMKLKGKIYFSLNEILNFQDNYLSIYPSWCKLQLEELGEGLIKKLLEVKLLEEKQTNQNEKKFYKWSSDAGIDVRNNYYDLNSQQMVFLENFIQLEKYCRTIYIDLLSNNKRIPLSRLIKELYDIGIIDKQFIDRITELNKVNVKIRHGELLNEDEISRLTKEANDINVLIDIVIEQYCFYMSKKYFEKINYNIRHRVNVREQRLEFDILAESLSDDIEDIIFEIKCRKKLSSNDINSMYSLVRKLIQYNKITNKKNKLAIFVFGIGKSELQSNFISEFNKIISEEYSELEEYIEVFIISEEKNTFNIEKVKDCFYAIIKRIDE
ncbi:ATP-binding protein [Clostridium butyricum]|uniref:ATP-binding protein n=1 Tax=Clostridium butyricum TaxID=1492 RepID=UPI00374F8034